MTIGIELDRPALQRLFRRCLPDQEVPTDAAASAGNWRFFAVTYDSTLASNNVQFYFGSNSTVSGKTMAHLSDSSAADYVDTSFTNTSTPAAAIVKCYTFTYKAASAGQTLKIIVGTAPAFADCSANFQGAWDSTNLYILASVNDDVKKNDSTNPWDDDAVEVFVDGGNNKTTSYDANDRQYVFGWGDTTVVEPGNRNKTGVVFAKADPTTTSYRIEVKIPWSAVGVTVAANQNIGLDVHVDDDDDGAARDAALSWSDGNNTAWTNPSVFGTVTLQAACIPPDVPTGLSVKTASTQALLLWNPSYGATSYTIRRSANGGAYSVLATNVNSYYSDGLSSYLRYTDTGLTNGVTYCYTVAADNGCQSAQTSSVCAVPKSGTQPAPSSLVVRPLNGTAEPIWHQSPGAIGYNVKRSTSSGGPYTLIGTQTPDRNSFLDGGLTNGITYYYVVSAVGPDGSDGPNSAQASATPYVPTMMEIGYINAPIVIDARDDSAWHTSSPGEGNATHIVGTISSLGGEGTPTDLNGSFQVLWENNYLYFFAYGGDDVIVNDSTNPWDDDAVEVFIDGNNSKGTSYDGLNDIQWVFGMGDTTVREGSGPAGRTSGIIFVESVRWVEGAIPWTTIGVTPATGNLIGLDFHFDDDDDGGARDGKLMWSDTTDIAWSKPSVFGTAKLMPSYPPYLPGTPQNVTATAGNGQVALSWSPASGATSYTVKRSTVGGGPYTTVGTTTSTSFINTGLSNTTRYYYVVSASNSSGESPNSAQVAATPL